MDILEKSISELMILLESGQIKSEDLTKKYIENIEQKFLDKKLFKTFIKDKALEEARKIDEKRARGEKLGKIAGIPLALMDDISTKGILTTAGSKMLGNYVPPFNATVVERLLEEGAIILGKIDIEEFNLGKGLVDNEKILLEAGAFLLGSNINAKNGLFIKPSYGAVSRYGFISASSSLGQIGVLAKNTKDLRLVLSIISGYDEKDSTSIDSISIETEERSIEKLNDINIGLLSNEDSKLGLLEAFHRAGLTVNKISLNSIDYVGIVYEILTAAEFSSNAGRYDGIGFGYRAKEYEDRDELYKKSRGEAFGKEAKKTIIFGNYVISSEQYDGYYKKSQQLRRIIKNEVDSILEEKEFLILAFDSEDNELMEAYDLLENITGYPSISIPCSNSQINKLTKIKILARPYEEDKLLNFTYSIGNKLFASVDKEVGNIE